MTKEATPQPWYTKPIQVPLFVLLMGGLAGGGSGEVAKRLFGGPSDTVDSTARADIAKLERKLDTVSLRQDYIIKIIERMERKMDNDHQDGED